MIQHPIQRVIKLRFIFALYQNAKVPVQMFTDPADIARNYRDSAGIAFQDDYGKVS